MEAPPVEAIHSWTLSRASGVYETMQADGGTGTGDRIPESQGTQENMEPEDSDTMPFVEWDVLIFVFGLFQLCGGGARLREAPPDVFGACGTTQRRMVPWREDDTNLYSHTNPYSQIVEKMAGQRYQTVEDEASMWRHTPTTDIPCER